MDLFQEISQTMQTGNANKVRALITTDISEGASSSSLLDALIAGMSVVGVKFKNNEVFVPEVLVAARAMNAGLDIIRPLLEKDNVKPAGSVVIGTVQGDVHDIGKNLVGMMLVGAGYEVTDLGTDVSPERFVEAVKTHKPQIVALSALLTTTMANMKVIISALRAAGLRDQVKVMVGGAPITQAFSKEIGADGYSEDAVSAVTLAGSLIGL